MIWKILL